MKGYTDEELADLTPEEREGLAELEAEERAENGEGDGDEAGEGAGDPPAPEPAGKEPAEKEAAAADEGEGKEPPATEPAAAGTADAPAAPAAGQPVPVIPKYEMPANYDQRMRNLDTQRDAIAQRFEDGEITVAEYNKQTRALQTEEMDLREARLRAELSADQEKALWERHCSDFIAANPDYKPGSVLFAAMNEQLIQLQEAAMKGGHPANDPALIQEAHRLTQKQLRAALGLAEEPAAPKPTAQQQAPKPVIPPTLAHVPAAAAAAVDEASPFAYLDRLQATDPAAYEEALGKLTDEQRARYDEMA